MSDVCTHAWNILCHARWKLTTPTSTRGPLFVPRLKLFVVLVKLTWSTLLYWHVGQVSLRAYIRSYYYYFPFSEISVSLLDMYVILCYGDCVMIL